MLSRHPALRDTLSDEDTISERADNKKYSKTSDMAQQRHMSNVVLVEILEQNFKSYLEMLLAMMQPLKIPSAFRYLEAGYIAVCPGDFKFPLSERRPCWPCRLMFLLARTCVEGGTSGT